MDATWHRTRTLLLLLAGALACTVAARPPCAFEPPDGWDREATRWDGPCVGGRAQGSGVLKEYRGQEVRRLFFGEMKDGAPVLGVIDQPEGYVAGRFSEGRQIGSDARQDYIRAFDAAAKAAQHVSTRFSQSGNEASARFYEGKAKALREQMD